VFLFYPGTKQQVRFLGGTDREVSSQQFEGKRYFGKKFVVDGK
jgi:hypothetical protein